MQEKVLTISIASYNTENFIDETVRSLFIGKQYMDKMEIIIVNDGSKDRTSERAHALEKEYPGSIIVIDKENGGYGSTINTSLAIARGKYYKLLDGDDWYETKELTGFLDYLEKCESDIVVTPYYEVKNSDILIDKHPEISEKTASIEDQPISDKFFGMHESAIKTDVLRSFNKSIGEHCFYTDTEFVFYSFSSAETIARYSRPIYRYRLGVDGQSVSLQGTRKHHKDLTIVAKRIINAYSAGDKAIRGSKKAILDYYIQHIIYHTFFAYMLLEEPEQYKGELIAFDRDIKCKYHDAYRIGYRSKLVSAARLLHFHCYSLLCRYVMRRFEREQL